MNKKERQMQKALGTLLRFNVQLIVPIRQYAYTNILVEASTKEEANHRAKKIAKWNDDNLDDDGQPVMWYNTPGRTTETYEGTRFYWDKIEVEEIDQVK